MRTRAAVYAALLASAFLAGGCERFDMAPIFASDPKITVTQSTYGAVDALVTQAKNNLNPAKPLMAGQITPIGQAPVQDAKPAQLGQHIRNNVTSRFVQLGYVVSDTIPAGSGGFARISGDYTVIGSNVLVNLRVTDGASGQILGAHDFRLPVTREVREFIKADTTPEADQGVKPLGDIFTEGYVQQ